MLDRGHNSAQSKGNPAQETTMNSLFFKHFPITMLCLTVAWSCSDDEGSPEKAVGAATGAGGSGGSAAVGSSAGSGGATAGVAGAMGSGEMGGSNGLAQPGTNSNSSSNGTAQGGGAGSTSLAGAGGSAGESVEADAGAADAGGALVSYAKDIQPILLANCSPCHSTDRDGRHNAATSYADAVRVSADIVREIRTGGMPESGDGNQGCNGGDPGDPGCVSAADFALIQQWIADGTPQ
jgi:hypothetical protein